MLQVALDHSFRWERKEKKKKVKEDGKGENE